MLLYLDHEKQKLGHAYGHKELNHSKPLLLDPHLGQKQQKELDLDLEGMSLPLPMPLPLRAGETTASYSAPISVARYGSIGAAASYASSTETTAGSFAFFRYWAGPGGLG